MRGVTVAMWIAAIGFVSIPRVASAERVITRDEIVQGLQAKMWIFDVRTRKAADAERIAEVKRTIAETARRTLEAKYAVKSWRASNAILNAGLMLQDKTKEITALRIDRQLRMIDYDLKYIQEKEDVTTGTEHAIKDQTGKILDALRDRILDELKDYYTEQDIAEYLERRKHDIAWRISDLRTPQYKRALSQGTFDALSKDLLKRLEFSIPRARRRLEKCIKMEGVKKVGGRKQLSLLNMEKEQILAEIFSFTCHALETVTRDERQFPIKYTIPAPIEALQRQIAYFERMQSVALKPKQPNANASQLIK